MSAIGAALSRGVTSLGGPQVAAVVVAAGLVAGGLGGASIGSGAFSGQPATTSGELAVYPCPDQGPALLTVKGGQKMLATGRTEDGAWLRIHFPLPGRTEAWVQASPLFVAGAVDSLPVATCQAEVAAGSPDVQPGATLTAILNLAPTPAPTPEPTPTPVPTATPVPNKKPSLSSLTVSTAKISYDLGSYCPTAVKKVTFKVKAGDDEGVTGVTLFWRKPGATTYAKAAMSRSAGTGKSGTWQVTLDTTADGITKAGKLAFYAVVTDTAGATRKLPASGASTITVAVCANTGPAITSAKSSSGSSLYWDPRSVGNCQTATNITAVVKDADGVDSVTLFFRRPGSTTWSSKPMDLTRTGNWSANLDTLGDKITIVSPPTDTLSWYIKAVDGKGKASQTKTASITIRRCDSEANFEVVRPTGTTYPCTTSATIAIETWAGDPDQPEYGLKVVFYWTLSNPRTGDGPISGKMTANVAKGTYYRGTTAAFDGGTFYAGALTVYAVTTDKYNGTTKSSTGTYSMSCVK